MLSPGGAQLRWTLAASSVQTDARMTMRMRKEIRNQYIRLKLIQLKGFSYKMYVAASSIESLRLVKVLRIHPRRIEATCDSLNDAHGKKLKLVGLASADGEVETHASE